MKRSAVLVIAGLAMLLGGVGLRFTGQDAHAQAASTTFAVDVDPSTGGVQTSRVVASATNFSIDVHLTSLGVSAYGGYQVTIDYNDVLFDAVGFPTNWSNAPVLDTTGGNVAALNGGTPACDPNPVLPTSLSGEDQAGIATIAMDCFQGDGQYTTTYVGSLVEFVLQCRDVAVSGGGTGDITIHGVSDTFVLDSTFASANDAVANAQVSCGQAGTPQPDTPTSTATITGTATTVSTATPVPPTASPTNTRTPTRTPLPEGVRVTPTPRAGTTGGGTPAAGGSPAAGGATPRGGRPSGTIVGPNTGTGDDGGGSPWAIVLLGAGALFIGAGLTPLARRAVVQSRRTRGG